MKGYQPEKHLDLLFESLCSSTNFEAKEINEISQKSQKEFKNKTSNDILKLICTFPGSASLMDKVLICFFLLIFSIYLQKICS